MGETCIYQDSFLLVLATTQYLFLEQDPTCGAVIELAIAAWKRQIVESCNVDLNTSH